MTEITVTLPDNYYRALTLTCVPGETVEQLMVRVVEAYLDARYANSGGRRHFEGEEYDDR